MRTRPAFFSLLTLLALSTRTLAQNTAIVTDGATSYVSFPSAIVPNSGDFTVEFWAYIAAQDLSGTVHELVSQGPVGNDFFIGYQYASTTNVNLSPADTTILVAGPGWTIPSFPLAVASWTHFAITQTGGVANLYVNDSLVATNSSYSFGTGGANLAIGLNTNGTTFTAEGIDELRIWNLVRTQAQLKSNWWSIDPATSGLIAYYNMNEGSGTTINNTASTGSSLDGTLVNSPTWASSPLQTSSNAIVFDGVSDQKMRAFPYTVTGSAPYSYDLTSGTFELWAMPLSTYSYNGDMGGVRGLDGVLFSFHMNPGDATQNLLMWNGTTLGALTYTFVPGTWYHFAFVTDGTMDTTGVFINGAYAGRFAEGYNTGVSDLPIILGVSEGSPDAEMFPGAEDNVYLWNTMRTQTQIISDMTNPLVGNETGLLADYTFDQGIPSGNNAFLTTVLDQSVNNNGATLFNMPLSGSTGNYITHVINPLPVNWLNFTVTGLNNQALLQWQTAQEENSKDFVIQHCTDGSNFTDIGTVPAAGNSNTPRSYSYVDPAPVIGNNFYRLKEEDQGSQYSYSDVRLLTLSGSPNALIWYITGDKSAEVDYRQGSNQLYTVTDMTGRTLQQGQLSGGKLYLSGLASGVYVVTVFTPAGTLATKVVIQ
jgi:Concanavalin A-like lectin/glucanases superfamily